MNSRVYWFSFPYKGALWEVVDKTFIRGQLYVVAERQILNPNKFHGDEYTGEVETRQFSWKRVEAILIDEYNKLIKTPYYAKELSWAT